MTELLQLFKDQAKSIENKYSNLAPVKGGGISMSAMHDRLVKATEAAETLDQELTQLANKFLNEHKVDINDKAVFQIKEEIGKAIKRSIGSNTTGQKFS